MSSTCHRKDTGENHYNSSDYWNQQWNRRPPPNRHFIFSSLIRLAQGWEGGVHSIADLGCGKANMLINLHEFLKVPKSIGIDISEAATQYNMQSTEHREGHWEWHTWDLAITPCEFVPDASVDMVYSSHVIEHVQEPYRLIDEQWRMCRQGGMIVIAAPLHLHHREHVRVLSIEDVVAMLKDYANPVICHVDERQTEIVAAIIK